MKVLSARLEKKQIPNSQFPIAKQQAPLIPNLVLDQVQLEGKTPVSWKELQKGYLEVKIIK
jgi:hypothetical protein